jgi:hypothetical protein
VTDDQKFLFLNDELDERNNTAITNTTTYIFDISDLDNPSSTPYHKFVSDLQAIDHNLYVKGSYVYQANYHAGLRILDISNLETGVGSDKVTEVAYFDVYPNDNATNFQGAWSVYPYFKSGNVVVSSRDRGFFVVRPNLEHFVIDLLSESSKTISQSGSAVYNLDVTSYGGFDGNVDLAVSNIPNGMQATFSPATLTNLTTTDNVTLTITDLGTAVEGNYSIEIVGSTNEMDIPTQKMRVGLILNTPVLPVTWSTFTAKSLQDVIQLDWETATEFNTQGYEIQRSVQTDDDFTKLAWVDGKGTNSNSTAYQFLDENVRVGQVYYYRIKQIDKDGTMAFSKVVSAQITQSIPTISLTPNPAKDFVELELLGADMNSPVQIDLMSLDGKLCLSRTDLIGEETFVLSLNGLGAGIYILKVQSENVVLTERLIIY